jgi:hypothetical protein
MSCTLEDCVITGNVAWDGAGGALRSTLRNCTVVNNAGSPGGTYQCTNYNCTIYYNTYFGGPNWSGGLLTNCCTYPLPSGTGNFTNAPMFVDVTNGNLRLQTNSPCINAGNNSYVTNSLDLDGRPRIVGGTVDIGAYELQSPASGLPYAWLQQFCLPTDGSVDYTDPDSDGLNNWQEWLCGTNPTNALSALCLLPPASNLSGVMVSWRSVPDHTYFLDRATNLAASPAFLRLATGIPGQPGATTFNDTNAPSSGPCFYRVGIQP